MNNNIPYKNEQPRVLISEEKLQKRISELAEEINQDYHRRA